MSIQTLRRELADLPIARLLKKHQTFATHAKLQNATVRAVRDLEGNPYYRPRAETVRRWLQACESPMTFEAFISKHGVTVEELESRDPLDDMRARAQAQAQKPSGQSAYGSLTVSPSSLEGDSPDASSSLTALRAQIAETLLDIASHYARLAAKFDAHLASEPAEAPARRDSHDHADHPPSRQRVRR